MARKEYNTEEQEQFISVANELGIGPAMRELGYPGSHHTAKKWFTSRGIDMPTVSALQQHAASLGVWYKDAEELAGLQMIMDRYVELLQDKSLDADALNKVANGYQKLIQTKRLIEGKTTQITETQTKDGTDLEIARLALEMEEKNKEFATK
jgi:hypothetical protein